MATTDPHETEFQNIRIAYLVIRLAFFLVGVVQVVLPSKPGEQKLRKQTRIVIVLGYFFWLVNAAIALGDHVINDSWRPVQLLFSGVRVAALFGIYMLIAEMSVAGSLNALRESFQLRLNAFNKLARAGLIGGVIIIYIIMMATPIEDSDTWHSALGGFTSAFMVFFLLSFLPACLSLRKLVLIHVSQLETAGAKAESTAAATNAVRRLTRIFALQCVVAVVLMYYCVSLILDPRPLFRDETGFATEAGAEVGRAIFGIVVGTLISVLVSYVTWIPLRQSASPTSMTFSGSRGTSRAGAADHSELEAGKFDDLRPGASESSPAATDDAADSDADLHQLTTSKREFVAPL